MNPVDTLETAKAANPLIQLQTFGQSIWLDYIRRDLMASGELQRLITNDGLRGMTSNPSIFEKPLRAASIRISWTRSPAAAASTPRPLRTAGHPRHSGRRRSARVCLPEHEKRDGYVSLEVSPYLAHDTNAPSTRRGDSGRAWLAQT